MLLCEKAEQLKIASVITAEGDSFAADLIAKSISEAGEGLIELRKLEAAEDISLLMARSRNVNYLPSNQNILLNLNTQ